LSTATTINGLTHALPDASDVEWGGILSSLLHGLSYARRAAFVFTLSTGVQNGVYVYMTPGYASAAADVVAVRVPFTGKIRTVYFRARDATTDFTEVTLNHNAGTPVATFSIGPGTLTGTDSPVSAYSVTAGDTLYVSALGGADSVGTDMSVSFCIEAA
jgi:hypothetical protein